MYVAPSYTTYVVVLVKKLPALKKRLLSHKQLQQPNFSLGQHGEDQAVKYLRGLGYRIVDRNVRFKLAEVDIIAIDLGKNELVFIEVKTRSSRDFGPASSAVNQRKLNALSRVAEIYCDCHHLDLDYRFDIITVVSGTIHHYRNVTVLL